LHAYATTPGALPAGWADYTFWQRSPFGTPVHDQVVWHGDRVELQAFAWNSTRPAPSRQFLP
jgi:hypothetical protein